MKQLQRILAVVGVLLCLIYQAEAQIESGAYGYYNDALRYSNTGGIYSARIGAMGGAQTALGGDPSNIFGNPAGLGFYRKSELTFSPLINIQTNSTSYLGADAREQNFNFRPAQMAAVFAFPVEDFIPQDFRGGAFGISLVQLNNYRQNYTMKGINHKNSLMFSLTEQAEGYTPDQLPEFLGLAYDAFLIDNDIYETSYNPVAIDSSDYLPNRQSYVYATKGNAYQLDFSLGGNFFDKLYIGGGMGVVFSWYNQSKKYSEAIFPFKSLIGYDYYESINQDGSGVNFKLGAIFRPNDVIRFGFSAQTPTFMSISEDFSRRFEVRYNNYDYYNATEPLNYMEASSVPVENYDFRLITPWRTSFGTAVFFKKYGLITADIEVISFGSATIADDLSTDFSADNNTISNLYGTGFNYRIGGEFRADPFRLRLGYAYQSDPIKAGDNIDRSTSTFSGGVGLNFEDFYTDFTVRRSMNKNSYAFYTLADNSHPTGTIDVNLTQIMLTAGYKF